MNMATTRKILLGLSLFIIIVILILFFSSGAMGFGEIASPIVWRTSVQGTGCVKGLFDLPTHADPRTRGRLAGPVGIKAAGGMTAQKFKPEAIGMPCSAYIHLPEMML
jgi:hypothetical protein